jgi:hypothetical protein
LKPSDLFVHAALTENSGPEEPATEDAVRIDDGAHAEQAEACGLAKNENERRTFLGFFSPKRGDTSTTKSPKPTSDRKPLGNLGANLCNVSSRSDDEEEEDDEVADLWVEPKVKVKVDPKTGKFKRPKGRMPSGVECWDETKGKWRLSMA